ncbi:MAG TPA: response regulator, partial [Chloroflexota bacterium]
MDTGLTSLVARNRKGPLVLVVDDEVGIVDMIQLGLKYEGYRSAAAFSGPEALEVAQRLQPDVVVLDVMLPGLDGRQVCRKLRAVSDVPVLMLTARDAVPDRVLGLDAGADDYLVKPFAFEELMARLRALLRRRQPPPGSVLTAAGVSLDARTREVVRDGRELRRFAADASHELRTPLTALRGYVEVLLRGAKDDPEDMGHA